jgi:hypothetical protein
LGLGKRGWVKEDGDNTLTCMFLSTEKGSSAFLTTLVRYKLQYIGANELHPLINDKCPDVIDFALTELVSY